MLGSKGPVTLQKLMYPAITVVVVSVAIICFIKAASFLSANLNRPFSLDQAEAESQLLQPDLSNYRLVTSKLGLPPETLEDNQTEGSTQDETETTEDGKQPDETGETMEEDKTLLEIAIYNGTTQVGLASKLKDELTAAGFKVARTGNSAGREATAIQAKPSINADFPKSLEELADIVTKTYELTTPAPNALDPEGPYDIIITIGKN